MAPVMPKQKLTDLALRGVKTRAGTLQPDYWDHLSPGFGVRVGAGGTKAFFVCTRIDGRKRRFTLKPTFPQLSLADARARAQQILRDAQVGIDPAAAAA